MLHSHFHSCFQCMWHTLSHLRGCIWNRIGYLHGKCICALRSTTINILNIFFPHIPCLFFFCLRFSYFIYVSCYSVFTVFCLRLSFIVLLVLVFIIIAYIIQLSTRNIWKKILCLPWLRKYCCTLATEKENQRILTNFIKNRKGLHVTFKSIRASTFQVYKGKRWIYWQYAFR